MADGGFIWTRNRLPAAMAALQERTATAVEKVARDTQADAVERAPIDTGFLKSTGYARRSSRFVWRVGFTAGYTVFVELGTSRMVAQPFIVPAWNAGRYRMMQALRRIGILG